MKLKRSEYLQVVGLLALATTHRKAMDDIEASICAIVGEKVGQGAGEHVGDAVFSSHDADRLLSNIEAQRKREAKERKK